MRCKIANNTFGKGVHHIFSLELFKLEAGVGSMQTPNQLLILGLLCGIMTAGV
jgi:hypothetical protein